MKLRRARLAFPAVAFAVLVFEAWVAPPVIAATPENLGRLFFTPQQRQDLDRRREANVQESAVAAESTLTVNGHVSRSSGKSATWINGVPQYDSHLPRNPARIRLRTTESEAPVELKIGETLDKARGEIRNGLEGGRIKVNPPASPAQ